MADGSGGDGGQGQAASGEGQAGQAAVSNESVASALSSETSQEDGDSEKSEETTETQPEKKVSKLFEQAKTWFPDQEFENEDAFHERLISDYNEKSEFKTKNLEANEKILNTLKSNEALSNVLKDTVNGVPFHIALAKHVDLTKITPQEGDEDYSEYQKAQQERLDKIKESEDAKATFDKNQETSREAIKAFFDSKEMDEAQVKDFSDFVDGTYTKMSEGIIDDDVLNVFYRAKNFDAEISKAKELSEISAKNEAIDLKKEETKKGDGLPKVGQGTKVPEKPKEKGLLEDMFTKQARKNDIYK